MHEIFLSYSRRDLSVVQALATALSAKGLSVWLDRSGIREGDAYDTQIEDAIAQTRVVIVLWSKDSVKSHWVRAEAAYALGKHKLLPISIDHSEPPLQFLHIQTIDFEGWRGGNDGEGFARLLAALAKRLGHSIMAGEPIAAGKIETALTATPAPASRPETPPAEARRNWIAELFIASMVAAGLRFPEAVIEQEFRDYYRDRTYGIAQISMLFALFAYAVYGVSDMASDTAVLSTRFRYMAACPLILIFYGLSYRKFAKRHSQLFIAAFAIAISACVYISVLLLGIETPFQIQHGNGTMNFMLTLGLLAMLPLSVVSTVLIGAAMNALHALIMIDAHIPLATSWLNYLHVFSMWVIVCFIAFWREYQQRLSFAAELS